MNLTFLLTKRCNLNCSYCYEKKNTEVMKFKTAADAIDAAAFDMCYDPIRIHFFGGEPTLESDLMFKIIRYCLEIEKKLFRKIFQFSITTNGVIIPTKSIELLKKNKRKFKIQVSLDGEIEDLNDRFDKKTGNKVIENIKKYKEMDVKLNLHGVITQSNLSKLYKNALFLKEFTNYPHFTLQDTLEETKENLLELENQLLLIKEDETLDNKTIINGGNFLSYDKDNFNYQPVCNCVGGMTTINPNGETYPCHRLASADDKRIKSTLFNNEVDANKVEKEECKTCPVKCTACFAELLDGNSSCKFKKVIYNVFNKFGDVLEIQ